MYKRIYFLLAWICSFYHSGTVLISLSSSLLAPCSNIGKTDQNSPLAVGQSCQRPQGIPQQGTPGSDGPLSNKKTVVSFWPGLSPVTGFHFTSPLMPSHLSTEPHYYRPLTDFHSHHAFSANRLLCCPLHLSSCSLTFCLISPTTVPHSFSPFFHLYTPPGSQGASGLPPSDRLRWHHGSSVLSKRRLGPRESFTFILLASFNLPFSPHFSTSSWLSS